jgi:coenzyme F420-dependent glucose-6-phosphate dehydrogenase
MAIITYHASHEQFAPSHLVKLAIQAEQAGFGAIHSSDHFHPWSKRQGHSGFSFAWMGAAMQATTVPFSMVCAPGQRYHPAIAAQAIATLAEMFPGRFSIELGSGEALNENITGDKWPLKVERNARLLECVSIIHKLLNGETVTHKGRVTVTAATLYTRPTVKPLLMAAALSEATAAWAGSWADGLITTNADIEKLMRIKDAFYNGGGENKPLFLQVALSYAATDKKAIEAAHDQWRNNVVAPDLLADLSLPDQFDHAARNIKHEDMREKILVSSNMQYHIDQIGNYSDLGFERIILHNVNRNQEQFIADFGEQLIPIFSNDKKQVI